MRSPARIEATRRPLPPAGAGLSAFPPVLRKEEKGGGATSSATDEFARPRPSRKGAGSLRNGSPRASTRPDMTAPLLLMRDIDKRFQGAHALAKASLEVAPG